MRKIESTLAHSLLSKDYKLIKQSKIITADVGIIGGEVLLGKDAWKQGVRFKDNFMQISVTLAEITLKQQPSFLDMKANFQLRINSTHTILQHKPKYKSLEYDLGDHEPDYVSIHQL